MSESKYPEFDGYDFDWTESDDGAMVYVWFAGGPPPVEVREHLREHGFRYHPAAKDAKRPGKRAWSKHTDPMAEMDRLDHDDMQNVLEGAGLNKERLVEKLLKELEATEVKVFNSEDGIVYSDELIAWKIRQIARMDAQKLMDGYPSGKLDVDVDAGDKAMSFIASALQKEREEKKKY